MSEQKNIIIRPDVNITEDSNNSSQFDDVSSVEYSDEREQNPLEDYMAIFGNPFHQTISLIMHNTESLMWEKEDVIALFEEMMDDTYENMRNIE